MARAGSRAVGLSRVGANKNKKSPASHVKLPKRTFINITSAKLLLRVPKGKKVRKSALKRHTKLSDKMSDKLSTLEKPQRRVAGAMIFLSMRVAYLEMLMEPSEGLNEGGPLTQPEGRLQLIIKTESTRGIKRRKIVHVAHDPQHEDYNRQDHINAIMGDLNIPGSNYGDDNFDSDSWKQLFDQLCKLTFAVRRNMRAECELLTVGHALNVVEWFSMIFGHVGLCQLSTLIEVLKKQGHQATVQTRSNACQLVQGRLHLPKNRPVADPVGDQLTCARDTPEGVKVLFHRIRQYIDAGATSRIADIMRLDRAVQVMDFYWKCKKVLQSKPDDVPCHLRETTKQLLDYVEKSPGRNSVEKFHHRLTLDLNNLPPTDQPDSKMVANTVKRIKNHTALCRLSMTFGKGVLALLPPSLEKGWIKDFPDSATQEVLDFVVKTMPNLKKLCDYLGSEVVEPLLNGKIWETTADVLTRAKQLLSDASDAPSEPEASEKATPGDNNPSSADPGAELADTREPLNNGAVVEFIAGSSNTVKPPDRTMGGGQDGYCFDPNSLDFDTTLAKEMLDATDTEDYF